MEDPSGTGMEVPILGAERDPVMGRVVPLAGSMEDPEGGGNSSVCFSSAHSVFRILIIKD